MKQKKHADASRSGKSENAVSVGVIGLGRMGNIHAENLALNVPHARLAFITSLNIRKVKKFAKKYSVPDLADDYHKLLEDSRIEAVVISTFSELHARMIQDAAHAGKHIFCEKPIGLTLEEIDEALAAVKKAGVKLQIGFNRRFDRNFRRVRDEVAQGHIGTPHILRITNRDPAPPTLEYIKVSGGLFFDFAMHDFDMARFLMGSEVTEIYATGAVRVDPRIGEAGDIDTALTLLQFDDGTLCSIDNSRKAVYGYDQRIEVFGSEGMVSAENNTPTRTLLGNASGMHTPLPLHNFQERYRISYIEEMKSFIESVQNDTQPLVTGEDGRQAVVLAFAAQRSFDEHRPVNIAEISTKVTE